MRLALIGCATLQREIRTVVEKSRNTIDVYIMPKALHAKPRVLKSELQKIIDELEGRQGEAGGEISRTESILVAYGLCCNGTAGIISRSIPIVLPRAHDCITLLLGSGKRYAELFQTHRGILWYSAGWIENLLVPGPDYLQSQRREKEKKYGPEKAACLLELENDWIKRYRYAVYIDWDFPESAYYRSFAKKAAESLGLRYRELKGNPALLQDLADGNWDRERFLIVSPGQTVRASHDENIIKALE